MGVTQQSVRKRTHRYRHRRRTPNPERAKAIADGTQRFLARGFSLEEAKSYARLFYEEGLKAKRRLAGLGQEIEELLAATGS